MYRACRKMSNISTEEASNRLNIAPRTLGKYEAEGNPPPETVLEMSKIYREPWMTQRYCRDNCAIGQAYSYEVLNSVNTDPATVLIKLMTEIREAMPSLEKMMGLLINKNKTEDFTQQERVETEKCLGDWMDVEHTFETLKISLGKWFDFAVLVNRHNLKCQQRGYVNKEKSHPIGVAR